MFFGPKFSTLVFTDNSVKIATATATSGGAKIVFLAKKSLPTSTVFNGRIVNENLFREALKAFFLENFEQLKTKDLVLGLNEQEIFITDIAFDKKPKNLVKYIEEQLVGKIPFDLSKASIRYKQISPGAYQIVATRIETLQLLSSIFEEVGFSLKALVPIPLVFPQIVGRNGLPYLFISSGEDLSYSLVVNDTVVFSSTINLKARLADSKNIITKIAREIIEQEYQKTNKEPLRTIFIFGTGADILKNFFISVGFNAQIATPIKEGSKQAGYDSNDFGRVVALSFYDKSVLSFPKFTSGIKKTPSSLPPKKKSKLFYLVLIFIFLAFLASIFYFRNNLKELFFANTQSNKTQQATLSAEPKPKEATSEAKKKESSPSAKIKNKPEEVNEKDFSIRILNGSGIAGTANEAKNFLQSKGYKVASTANADNFNYQKTLVRFKKSKQAISPLLTKDLKERYAIDVGSNLAEGVSYDVLIILGGE